MIKLETEKYFYEYHDEESDIDVPILQINKATGEKKWVRESDDEIWDELERAHKIS